MKNKTAVKKTKKRCWGGVTRGGGGFNKTGENFIGAWRKTVKE